MTSTANADVMDVCRCIDHRDMMATLDAVLLAGLGDLYGIEFLISLPGLYTHFLIL